MAPTSTHAEQATMKNLVEECHAVAQTASACAVHCIEAHGSGHDECIRLDLDAAALAGTLALFAARGSPFAKPLAQTAADLFQKSARTCRALGDDTDVMRRCAEAAEKAMETCQEIGSVR